MTSNKKQNKRCLIGPRPMHDTLTVINIVVQTCLNKSNRHISVHDNIIVVPNTSRYVSEVATILAFFVV